MRQLVPGILAAALLLAIPPFAAAFHDQRVYVASQDCNGHRYKPRSIVFACGDGNLYATGISYKSYGQRIAVAIATMHVNDCVPYCAAGHFYGYRGTIRLKDIVRCHDGRLYYSRVRYQFAGPHGSGTANVQPFEQCSRALG